MAVQLLEDPVELVVAALAELGVLLAQELQRGPQAHALVQQGHDARLQGRGVVRRRRREQRRQLRLRRVERVAEAGAVLAPLHEDYELAVVRDGPPALEGPQLDLRLEVAQVRPVERDGARAFEARRCTHTIGSATSCCS